MIEPDWRSAPLRSTDDRFNLITSYAQEWVDADDNKAPADYADRLQIVKATFGTRQAKGT